MNTQVMRQIGFMAAVVLPLMAWAGIFDVRGKPVLSAVVTVGEERPRDTGPTSPMLDQLRGVLGRLDKKECLELRAAGVGAMVNTPESLKRQYVIHLGDSSDGKSVEVLRDDAGLYYARELDTPDSVKGKEKVSRINALKFANVALDWGRYRGDCTLAKGTKTGTVEEMTRPYLPGLFYFDKDVMNERMHEPSHVPPTARSLETATIRVRLPAKYDARDACGLLVYVSPAPDTDTIPGFMFQAADELGLIVVAVRRIGNRMPASDRWQLVFDSVATASERYMVDPRRVYVTGVSGGAHITCQTCICFPDVFAGGVPIVAMSAYEHVPTGTGQYYQGNFGRPKRELLELAKKRRLAAITGKGDGNHNSVITLTKFFEKEGLDVRVSDYADMGHEAPTAERFAESLKWVDGPYRTMRETEVVQAELQLRRAMEDTTLKPEAKVAALVEVTKVGPWTPAAWKAVGEIEPGLVKGR